MSRSASQAFGREIADRLAALAIDIACDAPERLATYDTKVRAGLIEEARAVLEEAGVDWKKLVRARIARENESAERALRERLGREARKRTVAELERLLERADGIALSVVEAELARRRS